MTAHESARPNAALIPAHGAAEPNGPLVRVSESSATAAVPSAAALLRALRRRWLLAGFAGALAAAAAAAGVWFGLPPRHTAASVLHVPAKTPKILSGPNDNSNDFVVYQQTQKAMIKSTSRPRRR
jgi:hypothetical protein